MIRSDIFEKITAEYEAKRSAKEALARAQKNRIYAEIPALNEIDAEIAKISSENARKRILGEHSDLNLRNEVEKLSQKKSDLLKEHGYSDSDLEVKYDCNLCNDTGYTEKGYCSCFRTKLTDFLYDQMDTKELLKIENFQTYSSDYYSKEIPKGETESPFTASKKALSNAVDFIKNFKTSNDNLLITGTTGVGKTFLINCITKELLDRNYFVIYLTSGKFFDRLSDSVFGKSSDDNYNLEDYILKCDLLVIDDLGTELTNKFVASEMFNVINSRILSGKHTVISTNLGLDQIQKHYGDRIASRFCGSYKIIRLLGDDIRIRKGLGK